MVLVISFAGPEASAAYALYLAWVVIAAGGYLSHWGTAAHGVIAIAGYWLALRIVGPSAMPEGLQLAMVAGTAAVAAFVMVGLAAQMRAEVARLEDAARTDPLTGLDNRRALRYEFDRELARAERTRRPLALVVLDLDHFKRYNDAHGHPAGDRALKRVAMILEDITRSVEVTARIGGEEFAVVAPDTDEAGVVALAERLRLGVRSEFAGTDPPLTLSCGVAVHLPGQARYDDLIEAADRALYAAKRAGRNRVAERRRAPLAGARRRAREPAAAGRLGFDVEPSGELDEVVERHRVGERVARGRAVGGGAGEDSLYRDLEDLATQRARDLGDLVDRVRYVTRRALLANSPPQLRDQLVLERGTLSEHDEQRHPALGARPGHVHDQRVDDLRRRPRPRGRSRTSPSAPPSG